MSAKWKEKLMSPFNKLVDWLTDIGFLPTYYVVEVFRVGWPDHYILGLGPYTNKVKAEQVNDLLSFILNKDWAYTRVRKLDNY